MAERQIPNPRRNSKLRSLQGLANPLVDILFKAGVTADQVTEFGEKGTAFGSVTAAARNPNKPDQYLLGSAVAAGSLIVSQLADMVDGPLARREIAAGRKKDAVAGEIKDAIADRNGELYMAKARVVSALRQKDIVAAGFAAISGTALSLPSTAKARAETKGVVVPEGGPGTRVTRSILAIIATSVPLEVKVPFSNWRIKGRDIQIAADFVSSLADIKTANDRLKLSRSNPTLLEDGTPALSQQDRENAQKRYDQLRTFSKRAAIESVTLIQRSQKKEYKQESKEEKDMRYLEILGRVENLLNSLDVNHRIVGGTMARLVGDQTTFEVDPPSKAVTLVDPNPLSMDGEDGKPRDIDILLFTQDENALKSTKFLIARIAEETKDNGLSFPPISVEAAYQPHWRKKRNKLKQFVTMEEVDELGNVYFTYGDTAHLIDKKTLEPWKYRWVQNGREMEITSFAPPAQYRRYQIRVASGVKAKDKQRVERLRKMAEETRDAVGIDFSSWDVYEDKLKNPDWLTKLKSKITGPWWKYKWLGEFATRGWASSFNDKMG